MKSPAHFSASRVKLKRAKKFIVELEEILSEYQRGKPYTVSIEVPNGAPPEVRLTWAEIPGNPEAVIGDCVHNLRAALDLMACELVRSVNGNDNRVYFPFAHAKDELDTVIKEKNFHRAGEDAVQLLRTYAPYSGGNELLRALHDLDIEDKHKALIISGVQRSLSVQGAYNVDDPAAGNFTVTARDIHFIFPPEVLAGRNVIQTLKDSVELIDGILEAFASLINLRTANG